MYHTFINTNSYLRNYFNCLIYFEPRNLVVHKFWHTQWDIPTSHLILLQRKKIFIILLPTSMASSKNIQASTIATSIKLGMATTNNCIGAINCSQPKAHDQLQSQSTKESKVQTIISLDPLTRNKVINKDFSTLEHLKYGGKSPFSFIRNWLHNFSPT